MAARDVIDRSGRLQVVLAGLRCSRAEALALAVLVCGACIALVVLWVLARPGQAFIGTGPPVADAGAGSAGVEVPEGEVPARATPPGDAGEATRVVVHVSGLVASPGVYQLAGGGRVADAVAAAGGLLPGARPEALNLARPLTDGEQLHVPGPDEPLDAAPAAGPPGDPGAWLPDGRLDVNRATQADFEELPGIGPVLAERIVTHRDEVGGFDSLGDLLAVRGIGEKTLAALADLLAP